MTTYAFQDHIQKIDLGFASDSIAEQREVRVQSYITSVAYQHDVFLERLKEAVLKRVDELGVVHFLSQDQDSDIQIVLAYQGEKRIRTYDYDEGFLRLWSWGGVILETMSIRYSADQEGMLRFITFGGGRRLSRSRVAGFHQRVLGVPLEGAKPLAIDPERLTARCREPRFINRLFGVEFQSEQPEYDSIDRIVFRARKYMDQKAERVKELRESKDVVVEAFAADVDVQTRDMKEKATIRFEVRSTSGAIKLWLPKLVFHRRLESERAQAEAFYRVVDRTVVTLTGDGLFSDLPIDPALLVEGNPLFVDRISSVGFCEYLRHAGNRREFFDGMDLDEQAIRWWPHLAALDELLTGDRFGEDLPVLLRRHASLDPAQHIRLLDKCGEYELHRLALLVGEALVDAFSGLPLRLRGDAERALLEWALRSGVEGWGADPTEGLLYFRSIGFPPALVELSILPSVLLRAAMDIHEGVMQAPSSWELDSLGWVLDVLADLPPSTEALPRAIGLLQAIREQGLDEALRGRDAKLGAPVQEVEATLLRNPGLPLWPRLELHAQEGRLELRNTGSGYAWGLEVNLGDSPRELGDLAPGSGCQLPASAVDAVELMLVFSKFGGRHQVVLDGVQPDVAADAPPERTTSPWTRDQLIGFRRALDPRVKVVGNSPAMLEVFGEMKAANAAPPMPVLLLGESGVGKTHIARLFHDSSPRGGAFIEASGSSVGSQGNEDIARGEFNGFAEDSGVVNVPKEGKQGLFQAAEGGTLFLDDFEGLSQQVQRDLLAVLEGRQVQQVGGAAFRPDVRVILATNHPDLEQAVAEGLIRGDLRARVRVRVSIPPLRERGADVFVLARRFTKDLGVVISDRALLGIIRHDWPENVRELRDVLDYAARIMRTSDGDMIEPAHLRALPAGLLEQLDDEDEPERQLWKVAVGAAEEEGYVQGKGLQDRVAEMMGVSKSTASRRFREYGLNQVS